MKRMLIMMAVVVGVLSVVSDADARWRNRRSRGYSGTGGNGYPTQIDNEKRFYNATMSLQDIAYMRAQWMAHHQSLDHGIHGWTKAPPWPMEVGEGIGMGGSGCATCVVGSTVVADAECKSRSGLIYRVRFWK